MLTSTETRGTAVDCTKNAQLRPRYVTVDEKDYTVQVGPDGKPERMEVGFYGYRGRLTFREVKRDGATWRRVTKAMSR